MGGLETLPRWAHGLIESARVAHLALLDDHDRLRVLPVTFALARGAVWSAVDNKPKRLGESARVRFLRRRPEAALCVDHYEDDWGRLAWVQLLGRVELVGAADAETALEVLVDKYPQMLAEGKAKTEAAWKEAEREGTPAVKCLAYYALNEDAEKATN